MLAVVLRLPRAVPVAHGGSGQSKRVRPVLCERAEPATSRVGWSAVCGKCLWIWIADAQRCEASIPRPSVGNGLKDVTIRVSGAAFVVGGDVGRGGRHVRRVAFTVSVTTCGTRLQPLCGRQRALDISRCPPRTCHQGMAQLMSTFLAETMRHAMHARPTACAPRLRD